MLTSPTFVPDEVTDNIKKEKREFQKSGPIKRFNKTVHYDHLNQELFNSLDHKPKLASTLH